LAHKSLRLRKQATARPANFTSHLQMYFAGAYCVFLGAAVRLLVLLALGEASNGQSQCEDPTSCVADATKQPKALVQVRSDIRDGIVQEENVNAEFDCKMGVQRWRVGWSDAKKEWCCKNEKIGCEFNCAEGMIETWKTDKADWCCLNELVGCGFNCSAGYSKWKSGWSTLKKKYCCKNELLGCTFNCSKDLSNRSLAWPSMKKAWCCKNEKVGCGEEKKPCLTQANTLAVGSLLRGWVSPPGTPCVFGLDELDEGFHCILNSGAYGSFGWCYTAKDRSSWGACNEDCPLFGPAKKINDRLKNMTKELLAPAQKVGDSLRSIAKKLEGPLMSGSDSKARSDAGNVTEEAKKGDDKMGGKKDEKKDVKNGTKADAKNDTRKDGKKG